MTFPGQKFFSAWKKPRLSREILFWLALAGLFPFFILVLPQYFFAERALVDKEKQALEQALEARVYQVGKWLDNIRQDLDFIAESNCVQGLCSHTFKTADSFYCPFQEAVLKSHRAYRAIQIYSPAGELISRAGEAGRCLPVIPADRLAEIFAGQPDFFILPEHCFEGGATFVTVAKAARSRLSGKRLYILAGLNLNQAIDALFTNPFLTSGKFYILSDSGRYLYPPGGDPRLQGGMVRDPQQFLGAPPGEIRQYYDADRQLVLGAYRTVPGTHWRLVKEVNKAVVVKSRLTFVQRSLLAGLVALGVIFTGAFLVSRRLTKPLEELAVAANSISLGKSGGWRQIPEFPHPELNQVSQAFNDMQNRLRASEKALVKAASLAAIGEFSAKIVHDIRSPLSSINLALRSLSKSDLDGNDRERLNIAREQAARLMSMADRVLSYGKPLQLKRQEFTLGQLLTELKGALVGELAEKELELRLPEGGALEIPLQADRELLLQALANLLINAAQWSPPRGIIELEGRVVSEAGQELWLRIADSGPGFPEKILSRIFQPFFSTRTKGTGLGLANAKKIIDYHGGSIAAANQPGGGAEIIITLPLQGRKEDA